MADIHGLRALRLIVGKPVALAPHGHDFSQAKGFFLEMEFNDGSVIDVGITKRVYDDIITDFAKQCVGLEQRMEVRDRATVEGRHNNPASAEALALDATPLQVTAALNRTKPSEAVTPIRMQELDTPLWGDSDDGIVVGLELEEESDE